MKHIDKVWKQKDKVSKLQKHVKVFSSVKTEKIKKLPKTIFRKNNMLPSSSTFHTFPSVLPNNNPSCSRLSFFQGIKTTDCNFLEGRQYYLDPNIRSIYHGSTVKRYTTQLGINISKWHRNHIEGTESTDRNYNILENIPRMK